MTLSTSPDGQWYAVRRGREVALYSAAGAQEGSLALEGDDIDLALVGPPTVLVIATRLGAETAVAMHQLPQLEAAARIELDKPSRIAAVTGQRLALVSDGGKTVTMARAAGRALSTQTLDVGSAVEFAVGLERNQMLFSLLKKLEVWDAVSGRPMLKMQLQLPPAPRTVGNAQGHLWVTRPDSDEVFVYRLSDGRPFRHFCGSPVLEVVSHPASPVLVLVTAKGLVRLHCFAHSLSLIDNVPWAGERIPFAQLVAGDDIRLLGLPVGAHEPWQVSIGGAVAKPVEELPRSEKPTDPRPIAAPVARGTAWRDALAAYGEAIAVRERGTESREPELPQVMADTELGELSQRLGLGASARRALTILYALYLAGEAKPSLARFAKLAGDWTEALGRGELGALAMVRRKRGTIALRRAVTDALDGVAPRHVRFVGTAATAPRAGQFRVSRDGRADTVIEAELAEQLGRIAVVEGKLCAAILEARLYGATAVAWTVPEEKPRPWPRDAGLVLVLYGTASAWVADLPDLKA